MDRVVCLKKFLILIIVCAFGLPSQAGRGEKISLNEPVKNSLNSLLEKIVGLHEAFYNQDEVQIDSNTRQVINGIQDARDKSKEEKITGIHLGRVLDTAVIHFVQLQKSAGDERKKFLRMAFEQIVQIAQTYKLNSYRIFYCHVNDGVWLQKSWKAQNPYSPQTLANCGIAVR